MIIAEYDGNHLLAGLPACEWALWQSQLERVQMPIGQVLYEPGGSFTHVYFPTSALVSLQYLTEDGTSAEIAMIGNEGLVGIASFMGGKSMPHRAVVERAGNGFRLGSQAIKGAFDRSRPVRYVLLRYAQTLMTQMAQTAVCNQLHGLEQRLCRWLLESLDRVQGDELVMTQQLIASVLGVRRESITTAALKLQEAGLIRYVRGRISVTDRKGLEMSACQCYAVVKAEYHRLLGRVEPVAEGRKLSEYGDRENVRWRPRVRACEACADTASNCAPASFRNSAQALTGLMQRYANAPSQDSRELADAFAQ